MCVSGDESTLGPALVLSAGCAIAIFACKSARTLKRTFCWSSGSLINGSSWDFRQSHTPSERLEKSEDGLCFTLQDTSWLDRSRALRCLRDPHPLDVLCGLFVGRVWFFSLVASLSACLLYSSCRRATSALNKTKLLFDLSNSSTARGWIIANTGASMEESRESMRVPQRNVRKLSVPAFEFKVGDS